MADSIYQLQIIGDISGQPFANVIHMNSNSNGTEDVDSLSNQLAVGWKTDIQPLYIACIPDRTKVQGYKVRRVNNGGGPTISLPVTGVVGTRATDVIPTAIGPCLSFGYFTGVRWRSGRIFLPGLTEGDVDANTFVAGLIAACDAFIVKMLDTPTLTTAQGGWQYCIWRRGAATFQLPETGTLIGRPGVQRRRMLPSF